MAATCTAFSQHFLARFGAALLALRILVAIATETIYSDRILEHSKGLKLKAANTSSIFKVEREQVIDPVESETQGDDKHQENPLSIDWEGQQTRQAQASTALQHLLKQEKIFENGKLSEQDYVLKHGFPLLWEPCAVERIFQQKPKVTISVVGGSATAIGGGGTCRHGTILGDRYSNQLQYRFDKEHTSLLQFETHNYGQGSSESTHSALVLDSLIDANETDVIVWEYLINDGNRHHQYQEVRRKLDFWLRRVQAHYAQVGKPPPLILLNFLWDTQFYHIDCKPMEIYGNIITQYRDLGWDIAAINVGGAVNQTNALHNPYLLLRDKQHPGCNGVKLIASMLQYVFYTNLADSKCSNTAMKKQWRYHPETHSILPPTQNYSVPGLYGELWKDLFQEDTHTGSLTAWEPKYQPRNITNLQLLHNPNKNIFQWPFVTLGEVKREKRGDRKHAFVISNCQEGTKPQEITIVDSDLKWLGLLVNIGDGKSTQNNWALDIYINGVETEPIRRKSGGYTFMNNWINLHHPNSGVPLLVGEDGQVYYKVRFCAREKTEPDQAKYLSTIVGVSVPDHRMDATSSN